MAKLRDTLPSPFIFAALAHNKLGHHNKLLKTTLEALKKTLLPQKE